MERIAVIFLTHRQIYLAAENAKSAKKRPLLPLLCALCVLCGYTPSAVAQTNDQRSLLLVVGAAGEPEYGEAFARSADLWTEAAGKGGFHTTIIGRKGGTNSEDRTQLLTALTNEAARPGGEFWIVFIGHGTSDGRATKFNLRGPDVSAEEIGAALKPCARPLAVINGASASSPFITALSGTGRVIVTATRSGNEINATRFGNYLARAVADRGADLDKDGQTSLLEAYLMASRQTDQFYKDEGRLATEHPLLDDNGDGLGTPADWFRGVRAVKSAAEGKAVDGVRAHQMHLVRGVIEQELPAEVRARRDELEQRLSALRAKRKDYSEADYYARLEAILLDIAKLYDTPKATAAQ